MRTLVLAGSRCVLEQRVFACCPTRKVSTVRDRFLILWKYIFQIRWILSSVGSKASHSLCARREWISFNSIHTRMNRYASILITPHNLVSIKVSLFAQYSLWCVFFFKRVNKNNQCWMQILLSGENVRDVCLIHPSNRPCQTSPPLCLLAIAITARVHRGPFSLH